MTTRRSVLPNSPLRARAITALMGAAFNPCCSGVERGQPWFCCAIVILGALALNPLTTNTIGAQLLSGSIIGFSLRLEMATIKGARGTAQSYGYEQPGTTP